MAASDARLRQAAKTLLRRFHPEARIIRAGGCSLNGDAAAIMAKGGDGFIQKPFSRASLSGKVREIFDSN